jgi:CDP-glucose 4,6-dehydratase
MSPPECAPFEQALRSAYEGKRVLLTGHTGFKGGWLSLWLHRLGAEVIGVALPPEEQSLFNALRLDRFVDHRVGDIACPADFGKAVNGVHADIVFHMAAQALVRPSYAAPIDTFRTNVVGTAVVLDSIRTMPSARGIVVVSSDKCYENNEWPWPYRETDAMGGADPYSASKGCTELVVASYRQSFFADPAGCQIASARAGNVFGGGDWAADRLVPDIIRATLGGTPVRIRNPASVRPWQHVLEPLAGYLMLGTKLLSADAPGFAEGWNFGPSPDSFVEVETIARGLLRAWGTGAAGVEWGGRADDPHEAGMLTLDSSKARVRLGWKPRITAAQAIAMTAEWYRSFAKNDEDMLAFSEAQIAAYCASDTTVTPIRDEIRICA